MAWIKRNLYFVIAIVVGLGATGYCAWLLYSALGENVAASAAYEGTRQKLKDFETKTPSPDADNIAKARTDKAKVADFLREFRKCFSNFPKPPEVDARGFKEYLQKCITQFTLDATNAGVALPTDQTAYEFSFQALMNKMNLSADEIGAWMQQLEEIKAILNILYTAKINKLTGLRRPMVGSDDGGTDDYIPQTIVTNQWGVVTPYKVDFRSFSADLAAVLAGFAHSSNCFIVKGVYVVPDKEQLPQAAQPQPEPTAPPPNYRRLPPPNYNNPYPNNPFLQRGGGGRGGYGGYPPVRPQQPFYPAQPAPVAETPAAPAGPTTILTETPLFVTIYVDVVKLKASEPPPPAAANPKTAAP
jgi:hypothetical protein